MTARSLRARKDVLMTEARTIHDAAPDGALDGVAAARWTAIEGELVTLAAAEQRQALFDEADRRTAGAPVAGDPQFQRELGGVTFADAIRGGLGGTDKRAGQAREASQEIGRRSGKPAQGIYFAMGQPEQRVFTTALPSGGPGSNVIQNTILPNQFIDRLYAAVQVRKLGATVISGLTGNPVLPRLKASTTAAFVNENVALTFSDPQIDQVTLSPHTAGAITEISRQVLMQSNPSIDSIIEQDMANVLAVLLDSTAISGNGTAPNPRGILLTSGIGNVAMGTNGAALTYAAMADLQGQVADQNAEGGSLAFLTNTKVRRAVAKMLDAQNRPLGADVVFQSTPRSFTNSVPSNLTKGSGTGLSAVLYGNWASLVIALWSELDILINPFESVSYSKGNLQVRALMTCDMAVKHPESFAAILDAIA
jgi:HK97 family phage major capsid protein